MKKLLITMLVLFTIAIYKTGLAQDTYPPDERIEQICDLNSSNYTCADIYNMFAYSKSYYYAIEVQAAQGQTVDYDAAREYAKQQSQGFAIDGRYQSERNLWQPSQQQRQQWQQRRSMWNQNRRKHR